MMGQSYRWWLGERRATYFGVANGVLSTTPLQKQVPDTSYKLYLVHLCSQSERPSAEMISNNKTGVFDTS